MTGDVIIQASNKPLIPDTQHEQIYGNIMVAPPFYSALYEINYYRLPDITYFVAVGTDFVVSIVKWGSNHDLAKSVFCWINKQSVET